MKNVTISGIITSKTGEIESGADLSIRNKEFGNILVTKADENGLFSMSVEAGLYYALFACKDYGTRNLEYWCWNLPAFTDLKFDIIIDGLEIYALNHYRIQFKPVYPINFYARVMSLAKGKKYPKEREKLVAYDYLDLAPSLCDLKISCRINGQKTEVSNIQIVQEKYPDLPRMDGIIMTIVDTANINESEYNRFDIEISDTSTGDLGQATYFWQEPCYMR